VTQSTTPLFRSALVIPLIVGEATLGLLQIDSFINHAFAGDDLDSASAIAQQAALAIHVAMLLQRIDRDRRTRDQLIRFLPLPLVDQALRGEIELALGGREQEATILFADIIGFTQLAEGLEAEVVIELMNDYFAAMVPMVYQTEGSIDKFIGDAIMAFWGPPFTGEAEHALLACRTALAQLDTAKELKRVLSDTLGLRKGVPEMNARVGLATGEVTVGSIGSDTTKGYTVIGDTVNLASRLESVNKFYGTRLLISEATREMAGAAIEVREIDSIRVKGKNDAVRVYELLALKDALAPQAAKLRDEFQAGLAEYRRSSWDSAEARFRACLALDPGDGPARVYLERVSQFRKNPPSPDWSGVWTLSEK
jgi:adenylate cyclase